VIVGYRDEQEFLEREADLLARLGTFLRGIDRPIGTVVPFELALPDGTSLLRGEGRVLDHAVSPAGERSSVIRFVHLDPASRPLVQKATALLVRRSEARGGPTSRERAPLTTTSRPSTTKSASVADQALPRRVYRRSALDGRDHPIAPAPLSTATAPAAPKRQKRTVTGKARQEILDHLRDRLTAVADGRAASDPNSVDRSDAETNGVLDIDLLSIENEFGQEERMENDKRNGLYLVAGSKGGVGKSMVTMAVIDLIREQGKSVVLVECDNSNPDVWKSHKDELTSELVNLDEADGWIRLLNICDSNRDKVVIVNTAARNNTAVSRFGSTLNDSLDELNRDLVALWVINRQRDTLELLREFASAIPRAVLHIVRNGYFGEERKFELYNSSPMRADIEGRGGKSITLPDLADRVADDLYSKHLSVAKASRVLPLGDRAELARWKSELKKQFDGILGPAKRHEEVRAQTKPLSTTV
jgi:hypothetical protein